ncbi:tyrosine-protein kinase BAZ1B-like [Amphiura filiformis]|uniref:tyrosine-protein kinase BAZ1B-like n=1 Tax=Amphiura filiformis TaxID=82378 RepID=UPI003B2191D9
MPLLGQKIYLAKAEENRSKKGKGKYEIPFTNEVFTSKEEYDRQMQGYKQPIWTCQCTGFTGLTYEEALRSETEVHKRLSSKFPKHLERSVLELVHHRAAALDVIVDEALQRIQSIFGVGETVELKVKVRGKIVRGKVVDFKQMCDDELPTSDKENSVSEDHPYSSPQHGNANKTTSFQYNVQVEGEDKVIHSIPGKDLLHTTTLPSRDLLQLFIRASAVQVGSTPVCAWVVSEELVQKFDLPSRINEVMLSPYKVMPSSLGNLTSIKRSAEPHEMASKSKKRKLSENNSSSSGPKLKQSSLMDFGKKDNMVLSVVLQRDQNTSNIGRNQSVMVTPPKRNPNIMTSPEKVHLDHSYSSPPPHLRSSTKSSSKKPTEKISPTKTEKSEKKKETKVPATKKTAADKKQSSKTSKSKAHSKKASKKKDGKADSEAEDVIVIDEEKKTSKSSRSSRSGKTDSQEDEVIIVDDSPDKSEKSSDDSVKAEKKRLPTKRKLTDHFKSVPGSSPRKSPSKLSKKGTESKEKATRKSPVKSKTTKSTKASKSEKKSSSSEDESSSSEDDFESDKKKSKAASKKQAAEKAKKQPTKKTPQKKQTKQPTTKKSATSKVSSKKETPKKGTPKKATPKKEEEKSTSKKATPKKAQTPSKSTPKKTAAKKATPKKAPPKKATTPKKGTPKKTPKKATPKKTPAKGTPGKKTPKKTPGGKTPGGKLKQATLFDVGAKKGSKKEGNMVTKASPKTPKSPRQPPIANKMCRIKKKDQDLYKKLVVKAAKELTEKQINHLKPEIKEDVLLKYKERMEKLRWQNMSPEEKEKILQARKAEKKKKAQEERQKKAEELRKLKTEQAKRYEDQDLKLKPLPAPKLVSMPEGIPNTLFGDIAMVVEFLNCYSGLLMPDDPYPITADSLMKALVYGKEGFAYLARVLVILLKTLLQDEIAEDWRELSMKLSDITVNMHTCSELLRMSLRRTDHEHVVPSKDDDESSSNFSDSSFEDEEDVPYKLVEKLETCEFFDLEPEDKLEILKCVCHRILGSYSIQDFMEQKQRAAAKLWREKLQTLKEKNDKLREEKQKKKQQQEAERLEKEKLKAEQENGKKENGENSSDDKKVNGEASSDKEAKGKKPKKTTKKESKPETKEPSPPPEEELDLASVVKRRRVLAAKMKIEKAEQEKIDKARRMKEQEIYRKQKEEEQFQKNFEDGIQLAKLALRQTPVGTDRNHSRYWIFSTVIPGLFIEKGWADKDVGFSTVTDENEEDDEPLKQQVEHTIPKVGQNLWFQYSSAKEIDSLLEALDNQGIRESALYTVLKKRYDDITRLTFLSRRSGPDLRDSDGPKELLDSFREDMSDLELNIRQGQLGGVNNFEKWEKKLLAGSKLKDLGALMIESFHGVNPKFLQGILAPPKAKPVETITIDGEDGDKEKSSEADTPQISEKVVKWIEAVECVPTLSRLHVLLAVFETCVKWEKSAANARCKICRKKGDDNKLLLCDECNQPFHLFCLRPALMAVPKGEWKCPACAPSERRASKGRDQEEDSSEDDEESDEEEEDSDEEESEEEVKKPQRGRGRGRPAKRKAQEESEEEEDSEEESEEEEVKKPRRGRGRPAKSSRKAKEESEDEEEDSDEDSEEEESEEEEVKKPQRGRGRPAKSSRKAQEESEEEEEDSDEEESEEEESEDEESEEEEEEVKKPQRGRQAKSSTKAKKPAKKVTKKKVVFDGEVAEGIVNKLMCYRGSVPFRTSPDRAEAPDYEEMIKIPMDLHMVKNKCGNSEYETYEEFFTDVKLIFTNAHAYYEESDYIRKQATKLEEYFVNQIKWANPDALAIYETISEADGATNANSTDENGSTTDQKPTRRSRRR